MNRRSLAEVTNTRWNERLGEVCADTDQVVVWSNTKQFSEVTKGDGGVGLKAEVTVVMSRSQVAAFTGTNDNESEDRPQEQSSS